MYIILIYRPTYIFCLYRPVAAGHFRPSSSGCLGALPLGALRLGALRLGALWLGALWLGALLLEAFFFFGFHFLIWKMFPPVWAG